MPSFNDCRNLQNKNSNLLQHNLTKQLQKSTINTAHHRSKASGLKSCQAGKVRISYEDLLFRELQYRDRLFVDLSGSNDRLNAIFVKQQLHSRLAFPSTSHKSTSLIQFASLMLSQPASSLFFFDSKLERANSRVTELDSRLDSRNCRGSRIELSFGTRE